MLNECLRKSAFCFSSSTQYVLVYAKHRKRASAKKGNGGEGKKEPRDDKENEKKEVKNGGRK